jgi:hypothetical protein
MPVERGVDPENPYQAPDEYDDVDPMRQSDRAYAQNRVRGPTIGLILISALGLAGFGLSTFAWLTILAIFWSLPDGVSIILIISIWGTASSIVVLVGAYKMRKLKSYRFAMAASVIAMLLYPYPFFFFGVPLGIWAIVVLRNKRVKAEFRDGSPRG